MQEEVHIDGRDIHSDGGVTKADPDAKAVHVAAGIDITCTTCYIKGTATAMFSVDGGFDAGAAITTLTKNVQDEITNLTEVAVDMFKSEPGKNGKPFDITDTDFDLPPIDANFNIAIPPIPACQLLFESDALNCIWLSILSFPVE